MKAVVFKNPLPIGHEDSLIDITVDRPVPLPRDLLVEIRAISVNPVDTKIRAGGGPRGPNDGTKIIGWDAAGVVVAVGDDVTNFKVGDEVYYAGAINRDGSYAEYQLVDERIVGRKPANIDFADTAAMPLTGITAWELLFDRMKIPAGEPFSNGSILIVGGAGGVGSIATQLLRQLTGLTIIATGSRPETASWSRKMGAHHVIDHTRPLGEQVKAIAPAGVNYVLALTRTEDHFDQIVDALAPLGAMGLIETPPTALDINKLKPKSISLHWEFMFTRSLYQTDDMGQQGRILNEISKLVEDGRIRSTRRFNLGPVNAVNLKAAHTLVESGKSIGKVVLQGF